MKTFPNGHINDAPSDNDLKQNSKPSVKPSNSGQMEPLNQKEGFTNYVYPLGQKGKVSCEFGVERANGPHVGTDIAIPKNTKVLSITSGTVMKVWNDARNGNAVRVLHDDGSSAGYAHLEKVTVLVGQHVEAGDQLGLSGNTGVSRGVNGGYHLHITYRKDANGPATNLRDVLGDLL